VHDVTVASAQRTWVVSTRDSLLIAELVTLLNLGESIFKVEILTKRTKITKSVKEKSKIKTPKLKLIARLC